MTMTPRLKMPLLVSGQAQKEITHNEALILLDAVVQGSCATDPANVPPSSSAVGDTYLIGSNPQGDWSGRPNSIGVWTASGWRFVEARLGFTMTDRRSGMCWRFGTAGWVLGEVHATGLKIGGQQIIGARQSPIPLPAGGAIIDAESRQTLTAILAVLRTHGLIGT